MDYTASHDMTIMCNELGMMLKEKAVTYFNVPSRHVPGGTEKSNGEPLSG
jgi:hypothetical protein